MRFEDLDLEPEVLDGLDAMNFIEATPIQEEKTEEKPAPKKRGRKTKATVEETDEFETDGIAETLLHFERASVAQTYLSGGKVSVTGEILLSVCSLKDETVVSYERQIPFRVELPVDESAEKLPVYAKTTVKSAQLNVTADEEKNNL